MIATRASRTSSDSVTRSLAALFFLLFKPCVHISKAFIPHVNERLQQWNAALIQGFHWQFEFLFFDTKSLGRC